MNKKPFNLEAFLAGAEIVRGDGLIPTETHYFKTEELYPIAAVFDGELHTYDENGCELRGSPHSLHDIFLKIKTTTRYLWVDRYSGYGTEEAAKADMEAEQAITRSKATPKLIAVEVEDE